MANNIRILYSNAADTSSSLTASTTSGALAASNLLTDRKSAVHRATGKTVQYDARWAAAQNINMVCLAFTNFSSAATMRVRGYTNVGDAVPVLDTGANLCCAYQPFGLWDWGSVPLGVNAFSYGGFAYARSYFTAGTFKQLLIDIDDSISPLSYVEAARLITGMYWSPATNAVWGAKITPESNTEHFRSEAGDLRTERRPVSRSLAVDLSQITTETDRQRVYDILRYNGMTRPIFVSLYPEDASPALEQSGQLYGKLKSDPGISHPMYGMFASSPEIEEV